MELEFTLRHECGRDSPRWSHFMVDQCEACAARMAACGDYSVSDLAAAIASLRVNRGATEPEVEPEAQDFERASKAFATARVIQLVTQQLESLEA